MITRCDKGGDAKTDECGGSSNGDSSCNGKGGKRGDSVEGAIFHGSGGAGYLTNGESVCGVCVSYDSQYCSYEFEECDTNNVIAEGGRAYVNGNKGGLIGFGSLGGFGGGGKGSAGGGGGGGWSGGQGGGK